MTRFTSRSSAAVVLLLISLLGFSQMGQMQETEISFSGLNGPESVAVGPDGRYYASEIAQFGANFVGDGTIAILAGNPFEDSLEVISRIEGFDDPLGSVFIENDLYVVDRSRIWKVSIHKGDEEGEISAEIYVDADAFPIRPNLLNDITVDAEGVLYASDSGRGLIFRIDMDQSVEIFAGADFGAELASPNGVLIDTDGLIAETPGSLLVVDFNRGELFSFEPDGSALEVLATGLIGGDGLAFGNDGLLYVGMNNRNRVVRVNSEGELELVITTGSPADIAIDLENNWLLIPSVNRNTVTFYQL